MWPVLTVFQKMETTFIAASIGWMSPYSKIFLIFLTNLILFFVMSWMVFGKYFNRFWTYLITTQSLNPPFIMTKTLEAFFFFFFDGTGVWTQGFVLTNQEFYHLSALPVQTFLRYYRSLGPFLPFLPRIDWVKRIPLEFFNPWGVKTWESRNHIEAIFKHRECL
jgi:hypothetical protein